MSDSPDEQHPAIEPDVKDWTFVTTDGCRECGFSPGLDVTTTGTLVRESVPFWTSVLERSDVRERPESTTWSALEYACHVRDVCRIFRTRLSLMLESDPAQFDNWDQDAAAVAGRYHEADPTAVASEYEAAAAALADDFDTVAGDQWMRRGIRSNGSEFTVTTFALYLLHDLHHHTMDVTP